MEGKYFLTLLFCLFLVLPLCSAAFQLNNYTLEKEYSKDSSLAGNINISFSSHPSTDFLQSSFGGKISLLEFLKANNVNFTCLPVDCKNSYSLDEGANSVNSLIASHKSNIFSFKIDGIITGVTKLNFDFSIDNNPSCSTPVSIDLLDDGKIDWYSDVLTEDYSCYVNSATGCFNESDFTDETVNLDTTFFCQNITLSKGKKFIIGASLRKRAVGANPSELSMVLLDDKRAVSKNCKIPVSSIRDTDDWQDVSCSVTFTPLLTESKDYFVCIKSDSPYVYQLKTEHISPCGYYSNNYNVPQDYSIFARSAQFANIGTLTFNQSLYSKINSGTLADYVKSYLNSRYNNNCTDSCPIPIKITSNSNDQIGVTLYNTSIDYTYSGGGTTFNSPVYNAQEIPSLISSNDLLLNLRHSNTTISKSPGNYTLSMTLGGEDLFSGMINVRNITEIKSLLPSIVFAKVKANFLAELSDSRNISEYKWNFGDNSTIVSSYTPAASHTYDSIGTYTLTLEITTSSGIKSSKSFQIASLPPLSTINSTLLDYKKRINSIEANLTGKWYSDLVKQQLNLASLNTQLSSLETRYQSATSDAQLISIMANLSSIRIPRSIKTSSYSEIPYFVDSTRTSPALLQTAGAGSYDSGEEEGLKKAIAIWNDKNLDLTLGFQYLSGTYEQGVETIATLYSLKANAEDSLSQIYLVIEPSANVKTSSTMVPKELTGATALYFSSLSSETIEFSVSQTSSLSDLSVYFSPELDSLTSQDINLGKCNFNTVCEADLDEDWQNCITDCRPWVVSTIYIILIIIGTFILYLGLQWWYKFKYEGSLFKSRADVYNIINFINNAISQGLSDSEIKDRLRKAGWKSEQIDYATKKVKGKAIMPFDFLKLFKGMPKKLDSTTPKK